MGRRLLRQGLLPADSGQESERPDDAGKAPGVARWLVVAIACLIGGAWLPVSAEDASEVTARITSVTGVRAIIDVGIQKGLRVGTEGEVWYELVVGGNKRRVPVGQIRITQVGADTSEASIVRSKGPIQP